MPVMPSSHRASSILPDGRRNKVHLGDVSGRFSAFKTWFFGLLILVYIALPVIKIGGHPAILFDIEARRFYIVGSVFNAQDAYLVFFLISGVIFSLFYLTAVAGRVWCGFACPQTVFLEGVFRRIERWVEGPRATQIALAKAPWSWTKLRKLVLKHGVYLLCALAIAHVFLGYFIPLEELFTYMKEDPRDHWTSFMWIVAVTAGLYVNFAWFREQLCLIVCPYGRMQSALIDDDTIVVGYDSRRGEPRGKKKDSSRGACINCRRCVDVCPTGIDIREGLQLECIGCANCIDACNDIMRKVGQAPNLIRFDSLNGLAGKPKRILRPRLYLYTVMLLVGIGVLSFSLCQRRGVTVSLLRLSGAPYIVAADIIRNQYTLHLINKTTARSTFSVEPISQIPEATFVLPIAQVALDSLEGRELPFFVQLKRQDFRQEFPVTVRVTNLMTGESVSQTIGFLGPDAP